MMLAQALAFAPAFTAALVAAHRLFQILDRTPKVVSAHGRENTNTEKVPTMFEGIRFANIEFKYPTRPDVKILNGLNLEVQKGKTVALVGRSGCGKSTCIQLLMRLYDPDSGTIVSLMLLPHYYYFENNDFIILKSICKKYNYIFFNCILFLIVK